MRWFWVITALLASLLVFLLVPDHAHGIMYVASGYLIASYFLIPRRPYLGWCVSFAGNMLYLYPVWLLRRLDLMVLPSVFVVLALWNAIRELNKTSKN